MRTEKRNLPAELALLGLLALLWGSSYLFIKVAVADIPPVSLIAFRVAVAALFPWSAPAARCSSPCCC